MKIRVLHFPFYVGLTVLFISTILRFYQLPGSDLLLFGGSVQESFFTILTITEIAYSRKAAKNTKTAWLALYCALPIIAVLFVRNWYLIPYVFVAGMVYLQLGRKRFVTHRKKVRAPRLEEVTSY